MPRDIFVHDAYFRIGGVQIWPPSSLAVAVAALIVAMTAGIVIFMLRTRRRIHSEGQHRP